MTNVIKELFGASKSELPEITRIAVPDSIGLQRNIVNATKHLAQDRSESETLVANDAQAWGNEARNRSTTGNFLLSIMRKLTTAAPFASRIYTAGVVLAFIIIASSMTLWLPFSLKTIDDVTPMSAEQLLQELAWQDLLLMQDELAFAEL